MLITKTLPKVIEADGIADIMELKQIPFGNNFYTTKECGGAPYDPLKRHCWAGKCVVKSPAADCFAGKIVSQHGDEEKNINRMQACGKWQNTTWQDYWPFLECMESAYETQGIAAAKECVKGSKIDYDALEACYKGEDGNLAQIREAKQTVDHEGTPSITIGGKAFTGFDADPFIKAVCDAYAGSKPAGCKSSTLVV
mmetsp:Transcript_56313/g.105841  ORF Transcript_56313/g.105841 Transcript_56313/m.105841 type:complete len:197 (-) Transcript_56313:188-778(-)